MPMVASHSRLISAVAPVTLYALLLKLETSLKF